ncbi:hypothetical protein FBU59_003079 [Linderina macrospora]|uniref:Uncharacterized protein n=1 Tax=Linderina macrospora TaxID=4868 RepID=A0ACC1J9N1_9FUNG|nr:hypothetical protein FBU59_003079 [Linderina macrospora]
MFPAGFRAIYKRIEQWQAKLSWFDVLVHGTVEEIDSTFAQAPGRLFLGLMCEYAILCMCMIKDTWLPSTRAMTTEEETTLEWARSQAVVSARLVHRTVPLIRRTQLRVINPFVSCIVFQACIVSMYSCAWQNDPKHTMDAIEHVQTGLEYLEYVTPRWGFASLMSMSLRTLIVERGFSGNGSEKRGKRDKSEIDNPACTMARVVDRIHMSAMRESSEHPERPFLPAPHFDIYHAMGQTKQHQMQDVAMPGDPMPNNDEVARWERILRTGHLPDSPKQ